MAFNQRKFERDSYQTRSIFNTYVYSTDDPIAEVLTLGYFEPCRFYNEPGWVGGVIRLKYTGGIVNLRINSDLSVFPLTGDGADMGWYNYQDSATAITPISVPGTQTDVLLTNDALGPLTTNENRIIEVPTIWDAENNQFDFSGLKVGDMLDIRVDVEVITSNTFQFVDLDMVLGIGSGLPVNPKIQFYKGQFKDVDAQDLMSTQIVGILSDETKNFPARLYIKSDSACTVIVRGWLCKVTRR